MGYVCDPLHKARGVGPWCVLLSHSLTLTATNNQQNTPNQAFLPISADTLHQAYRLTEQLGLHPKDILSPSCSPLVLHHLLAGAGAGGGDGGMQQV